MLGSSCSQRLESHIFMILQVGEGDSSIAIIQVILLIFLVLLLNAPYHLLRLLMVLHYVTGHHRDRQQTSAL